MNRRSCIEEEDKEATVGGGSGSGGGAAAAMVEEEVRWLPWKGQRLREREKGVDWERN